MKSILRSTTKDESIRRLVLLLAGAAFLSCETPFTPKPSESEELFKLEIAYTGGPRLIEKIPITLTWSEVTVEEFSGYTVHRSVEENGVEIWEQRGQITDPLQVSYVDSIDDDLTFKYRVRIEDVNGNYRQAETVPLEFSTTHLVIPDDIGSIQEAYDSPFMDQGDTLWVSPGTYGGAFRFTDKAVLIQSVEGKDHTILESGGMLVTLSEGTLRGFTVRKGTVALSGSALLDDCVIRDVFTPGLSSPVTVTDHAEVRNCLVKGNEKTNFLGRGGDGAGITVGGFATVRNSRITNNRTTGRGGGLSVSGEPTIINTIIDHNHADEGGGGVVIEGYSGPSFINCVVYGNRSSLANGYLGGIFLEKGTFSLRNTIAWKNSGGHPFWTWGDANYSDIQGYSRGTGNISLDPQFVDPEGGDFHLSENSPCIDAGHPGEEFLDPDESRNDMGAYGGPYGEW